MCVNHAGNSWAFPTFYTEHLKEIFSSSSSAAPVFANPHLAGKMNKQVYVLSETGRVSASLDGSRTESGPPSRGLVRTSKGVRSVPPAAAPTDQHHLPNGLLVLACPSRVVPPSHHGLLPPGSYPGSQPLSAPLECSLSGTSSCTSFSPHLYLGDLVSRQACTAGKCPASVSSPAPTPGVGRHTWRLPWTPEANLKLSWPERLPMLSPTRPLLWVRSPPCSHSSRLDHPQVLRACLGNIPKVACFCCLYFGPAEALPARLAPSLLPLPPPVHKMWSPPFSKCLKHWS